MSETPWTPGEWFVDPHRPPGEGVAVGSDHDFPTSTGKTYRMYVAQFCNIRDARLIAAAPELAEALEKLLKPRDHIEHEAAVLAAHAALAKAKGETP